MGASNFAARYREHEFTSGRTVVVRESLSFFTLMRRMRQTGDDALADMIAAFSAGETIDAAQAENALRMQDALVKGIVAEPEVLIPEEDKPAAKAGYGTKWCWISDFTDDEIAELIDLASQGVGHAHGFPGDGPVDEGGGDGEVLGDDPEPRARPKKRKR